MKDIEIIIIDDNSKDNSLKIIKNHMKNDKRIKLIENKENRKILFCKSFAALNSRGKYIIEIDQDDMFIGNDVFDIVYNESITNNLDILHFKYISSNKAINNTQINFNRFKDNSDIINQPKLKISIFKTTICVLWGNLIRTEIYKKVIYNLWPIIINYQIIFQEDFLITFFILIYARKYKMIYKRLYLYFKNKNQASNGHRNNLEYYLSVIFAGIIFYDFYIDLYSEDLQIIINYNNFLKSDFKKIKCLYPRLFSFYFEKILTNSKLLKENKINIMREFNISDNFFFFSKINSNKSLFSNDLSQCKNRQKYNNIFKSLEFSVIIVFSKQENINNLINSINAQKFKHFEIILIYDDEIKLDDLLILSDNIRLIKNEFKKGNLKSIIDGIKIAKGNYLMILNPKSFFLEIDAFENLYKEIKNDDYDILEFNLYKILSNKYIYLYKCRHYDSQLDLNLIKFNLEYNNINIEKELLTNKLFKKTFLKNVVGIFERINFNGINDIYFNEIFSFLIGSTFHKFKLSSKINIYINDCDCNKFKFNNFSIDNQKLINETINYIDFIFDYSKDTYESKEKVLKEFLNVLSIVYNKFTFVSNSSFKLLNKFYNCKYISKSNKTMLNFYFNSLII